MQTQEYHSNLIQALNFHSLKADLVVTQNTCSEKEDSNSETASSKSVTESSLYSATKDVHAIKYKMSKAKEGCMAYFCSFHSHLQDLSKEDLKVTRIEHGFKQAFMLLFGQDNDTFTSMMLLNIDQLQKQLDKDEFEEDGSMAAFWVEDDDLVITKSSRTESEVQDNSNRLGNDTDADNVDIRPIYDEEPMAERRESAFAKPDQVIASSESRNSSKNMLRFSSNDMVHNHYLDEARKMTQERDRNSKTSVMPYARFQSTADGSKPKPRSTNHSTRILRKYKSSCKCVFNVNHDACIIKILKEVNSRAKIQSHKTRNSNKLVDQKSHTQKPGRQIITRHRFSPNKISVVYEKTSPRCDLRWKPTGRIFKTVGLRWVPTGKILASYTSKADSEHTHGSNASLLNVKEVSTEDMTETTSLQELESLFGPLFDEYFDGENQVVSKSSTVNTADASDKRHQQLHSTSSTSTLATTVAADGNFDL
ncbi:hypothetical protein Tco_1237007 [Tanacetum coccineum]